MFDGPHHNNQNSKVTLDHLLESCASLPSRMPYELIHDGALRSIAPSRFHTIVAEPGNEQQQALAVFARIVLEDFENLMAEQAHQPALSLIWVDGHVVRCGEQVSLALLYRIRDHAGVEYAQTNEGFYALTRNSSLHSVCCSIEEPDQYVIDTHLSPQVVRELNNSFASLVADKKATYWNEHLYADTVVDYFSAQIHPNFDMDSIYSAQVNKQKNTRLELVLQTHYGEFDVTIRHNGQYQNLSVSIGQHQSS